MSQPRRIIPVLLTRQINRFELVLMRVVWPRIYFDQSTHPKSLSPLLWQHSSHSSPQYHSGVPSVQIIGRVYFESARIATVREVFLASPFILSSELNVSSIDHHTIVPIYL